MIICHNMAVTYVSEYLTGENINNMPTCGVTRIDFAFHDWQLITKETGILKFFFQPKELGF